METQNKQCIIQTIFKLKKPKMNKEGMFLEQSGRCWLIFLISFDWKFCMRVTVVTVTVVIFKSMCPGFHIFKHSSQHVPYLKQLYLNMHVCLTWNNFISIFYLLYSFVINLASMFLQHNFSLFQATFPVNCFT